LYIYIFLSVRSVFIFTINSSEGIWQTGIPPTTE